MSWTIDTLLVAGSVGQMRYEADFLDWLRIRVQKPGALVRLLERFLEEAGNYIIVLQHTDCGITRLAAVPSVLKRYFQIQDGELKTKAVTDPRAAVAVDVAMHRAIPALPGEWLVSGLVYEVATGIVEIVVPPARVRVTVQSVNSQPSTSKSWFLLVSCDPMIRFCERRWIMTLCIKPSVAMFTNGGTLCE